MRSVVFCSLRCRDCSRHVVFFAAKFRMSPQSENTKASTKTTLITDVLWDIQVRLLVVRAAVTCAVALQLGWPEGVQTRSGNLIFIPQSLLTVAALMHHGRVYWSQDASL